MVGLGLLASALSGAPGPRMETGGVHIPARNDPHPPRGTTKAASELQIVYRQGVQTWCPFHADFCTTGARGVYTGGWESAPARGMPSPGAWHRKDRSPSAHGHGYPQRAELCQ